MANLVDLARSYAKQETNPDTLERAKLAQPHTPKEPELDYEEFTDKQTGTICQLGGSPALSERESLKKRELRPRGMNAGCEHPDLGGRVVQQGGSRAPISMVLEGADKDRTHAAHGHAKVGTPQGPAIPVPGWSSGNRVRPAALPLNTECKALENFKALTGLGKVASQKRATRDTNCLQNL